MLDRPAGTLLPSAGPTPARPAVPCGLATPCDSRARSLTCRRPSFRACLRCSARWASYLWSRTICSKPARPRPRRDFLRLCPHLPASVPEPDVLTPGHCARRKVSLVPGLRLILSESELVQENNWTVKYTFLLVSGVSSVLEEFIPLGNGGKPRGRRKHTDTPWDVVASGRDLLLLSLPDSGSQPGSPPPEPCLHTWLSQPGADTW